MKMSSIRRTAIALAFVGSVCCASRPGAVQQALAGNVAVVGGAPAGIVAKDISTANSVQTATPIKHLVVLFQENVSFDHYFATYPHALNPAGEPAFTAAPGTPNARTLQNDGLLAPNNPNTVQPFRLARSQALTCDMNHEYQAEQQAENNGAMNQFVQYTDFSGKPNARQFCPKGIVMGYYDGNTVTALWNYAQHFAMNDNSFGTVHGPSTPGALVLAAGDTAGTVCGPTAEDVVYNSPGVCSPTTAPSTTVGARSGTLTGDPDQYYDDWSAGGYGSNKTAALAIPNIGDRLNASNLTWGWFNGGFDVNTKHPQISYDQSIGIDPATDTATLTSDYSAHHEPFQYFASTSNPHHLPPSSPGMIGQTDRANHQYDLNDFFTAADAGNLPAVSFLKAPRYQDGHPGNSNPLDEQTFLVNTINHLQSLPSWKSTAIIIGYDDSDGWYDHVKGPIVNHSNTPIDFGCGAASDGAPARCGYGPRLPYIVISPYARTNYVDHTLIDQTSTLRFIEDNWLGGQRLSAQSFDNKAGSINSMFDFEHPVGLGSHRLFLNPQSGVPVHSPEGFEVSFTSTQAGRGMVYFGSGPNCLGLVQVGTRDLGAGTTQHTVVVTGNDLPGTIGNIGITPGATYSYQVVTLTSSGTETDNNGGTCYTVTIPKP